MTKLTNKQRATEEMRYRLSERLSPFDHTEERPDGSFLVVSAGAHWVVTLLDASDAACG